MLGEKDIAAAGRTARSLWYESAGLVRLHEENLPLPGTGEALVRMQFSAVSRGTERLVCEGRVPPEEYDRMRAPLQEGSFPFPVKYGYCAVGQVEEGPAFLKGESVFALHPHQSRFVAPVSMLRRLPSSLPPRRAALAANMETALNAVWDSGAGPGDRIAVVGCGLVGLLVTYICAQLPAADVTAVDLDPTRTSIAQSFGARFSPPGALPDDMDIVFHASATASGLAEAIGAAGFEGKIIELSWYGQGSIATPLGGAFHSRRLQLISSQVGSVSAGRRPRWDYSRRLGKAIELLGDDRLDALITDEIAFSETPEKLPAFLTSGKGLAAVIRYD